MSVPALLVNFHASDLIPTIGNAGQSGSGVGSMSAPPPANVQVKVRTAGKSRLGFVHEQRRPMPAGIEHPADRDGREPDMIRNGRTSAIGRDPKPRPHIASPGATLRSDDQPKAGRDDAVREALGPHLARVFCDIVAALEQAPKRLRREPALTAHWVLFSSGSHGAPRGQRQPARRKCRGRGRTPSRRSPPQLHPSARSQRQRRPEQALGLAARWVCVAWRLASRGTS